MKPIRILAVTLMFAFGGIGVGNGAMLRHGAEQNPLALVKADLRPVAAGSIGDQAQDSAKADVMKKKKKKKTKAS